MELQDWFEVGRVTRQARLRGDVLTGVVALGRAVPEQKAVLEGFANGLAVAACFGVDVWCRTDRRAIIAAVCSYAVLSSILYQHYCSNISNRMELTATQLLNSGWRSPSEACTAGAKVRRRRHDKESSRMGGAKSRRCMLCVQRCMYLFIRQANLNTSILGCLSRAEAKRLD